MNLADLLPKLRPFQSVLVTGPQRSGTTIAAHILAHELGYAYLDEDGIGIRNRMWAKRMLGIHPTVLQAPSLSHVAHEFDCAVVFMRRPVADIEASQKRIGWDREQTERRNYEERPDLPIAAIKYEAWDGWQRDLTPHPFDLDYESLAGHELWVPHERRSGFHKRQWMEGR